MPPSVPEALASTMTRCPSHTHARDVRRVDGCKFCGIVRAVKDPRKGKSPARKAATEDTRARTLVVPRAIFAEIDRVCALVREQPELATRVNEALADALAICCLTGSNTIRRSSRSEKPRYANRTRGRPAA